MKHLSRTLIILAFLTSIPAAVDAQQASGANPSLTVHKTSLTFPTPGPLAMAASVPVYALPVNISLAGVRSSASMKQYGYQRLDWEFGRAWLGTVIGFVYGYIGDLIIHYEFNYSKGHYLLDEKKDGDNVYNVLLYCGIPPYLAMRGVRSVSIMQKNSLGSYLCGLVGSVAGLIYWTNTGEERSIAGFAAYTGMTALFAQIGYHVF